MLRDVARFMVGNLIFACLLAIGLQTSLSELAQVFRNRRLLWRSLLVIEIVIPLLTILIVETIPARPVPAGIALLFAVSPGLALTPFLVKRKGGRVPTAVGLLLVLNALAPVTI